MTFGNTKTGKTGTSTSEATETAQIKSVESLDKGNDMERGLKNRHVQFIAIGGTIGTGLFLGSGKSIALTGPSIILVYIGVGLIMFLLMRAIGEMMYSDPSQHTFINFITRYLGRGWGKFAGWTYWIVLILTGMTEITAVSTYFVTFFGTFGIDLNIMEMAYRTVLPRGAHRRQPHCRESVRRGGILVLHDQNHADCGSDCHRRGDAVPRLPATRPRISKAWMARSPAPP